MAPASPYVGAEPLSHDNPIFGRDREIRDLYFLLSKERIALLYSPSGAGKSSILYATGGLLDRFVDRFDVLPVTRVNTETNLPGANRYALSMLLGLERFAEEPRKESELASLSLRDAIVKRPGQSERLLTMIVADQFEEIVRIDPTDIDGKREFFRQLGELLAEPSIWALFVLREDFVATLDPYIRQLPTHFKNRYRIDLLKPEEAVKAIAGPAKDLERKWTDEAAKFLAENLAAETGFVEPMHLQIVCHDIWTNMRDDDTVVDQKDVTDFGDVDKVLGRFYARVVSDAAKLGHNNEREIRNWVKSELIAAGGVRGQVLAAEAHLDEKTIEILDKAHLLRREPRRGADWLELAHDRLVPAVAKNNAAWFADTNNLSDLERRAEQWDHGGRGDDLLADRWTPYRALRAWAKVNPARVKEPEAAFLKASGNRVWSILKWRAVIAVAMLASWFGLGYLEKEKQRAVAATKVAKDATEAAKTAERAAVDARKIAEDEKTKALIAATDAQTAGEEALGNQQMAEHAVRRANFLTTTLFNERAEQSLEAKDYPAAWIYTLAGLASDWPEGERLQGLLGRMLRTEVRPDTQWRNRQRESLAVQLTDDDRKQKESEIVAAELRGDSIEYLVWTKTDAVQPYSTRLSVPPRVVSRFPGVRGPFVIRFFPPSNQFVKTDTTTVTFLSTPRTASGPPKDEAPYMAMAQQDDRLAIANANGTIRFFDRNLRELQKLELVERQNTASLAFSRVRSDLFAIGVPDGGVALFTTGSGSQKVQKLGAISTGSRSVRSLTFLKNAPDLLVAGTEDGFIYVLSWQPSGQLRILDSVKLQNSPVVGLIDQDDKDPLKDSLIAVTKESIRRIPLTFMAAGRRIAPLDLMRSPRAKASIELYRYLLEDAGKTLRRKVANNRVVAAGNAELIPEADRLYYGAESFSPPYRIPKGELVRTPAGGWQWERDGRTTPLRKLRASNGLETHEEPRSKLAIVFPAKVLPSAKVEFRFGEASWFAAVENADKPLDGRIPYGETYIEQMFANSWRVSAPGRGFGPMIQEVHVARNAVVTLGEKDNPVDFPRDGGPLRAGGVELFSVVQESVPASRSELVIAERRTIYEAVSINGKGPIYDASPGERLTLDFRWQVEIADRSGKTCPNCIIQYYAGMRTLLPDVKGFSRCFVSEVIPQSYYRSRNGVVQQHAFIAPSVAGLYYITHRVGWDFSCKEDEIDAHSMSPRDAVAIVRVLP